MTVVVTLPAVGLVNVIVTTLAGVQESHFRPRPLKTGMVVPTEATWLWPGITILLLLIIIVSTDDVSIVVSSGG